MVVRQSQRVVEMGGGIVPALKLCARHPKAFQHKCKSVPISPLTRTVARLRARQREDRAATAAASANFSRASGYCRILKPQSANVKQSSHNLQGKTRQTAGVQE